MKLLFLNLLLVLATLSVSNAAKHEKKIVCYIGTWATYRWGNGKYDIEHINPNLCTHLIYSFFGIKEDGSFRVIDPYLDLEENWGRGNVKKFNSLKEKNPKLKTLAAVGGWNEGSTKFSDAAKDPSKRRHFIDTTISFLKEHKFDGLDLDWEYPAQRGGDKGVDKQNYVVWIKELRDELSKNGLLLTAAVASAEFSASQSYDIPKVAEYFDFINIMTYDLHGSWDTSIGINAPLFAGSSDVSEKDKQLNVHSCIQYWLKQGAPASKIILGVALYGRTFTLADSNQTKPGSNFWGPGEAGPYTQQAGFLGYNEICEKFQSRKWKREWEKTQMVPYAYSGNQWVGYDDVKSIELKAKYVNKYNLGGIMVWSLETDDFNGICGEKYPLMKTINKVLNSGSVIPDPTSTTTSRPSTTSRPQTTTQRPSTTTSSSGTTTPSSGTTSKPVFKCPGNGTFRDPHDCAVFYVCNGSAKYQFRCPLGLWYDTHIHTCNFKHLVECHPE